MFHVKLVKAVHSALQRGLGRAEESRARMFESRPTLEGAFSGIHLGPLLCFATVRFRLTSFRTACLYFAYSVQREFPHWSAD